MKGYSDAAQIVFDALTRRSPVKLTMTAPDGMTEVEVNGAYITAIDEEMRPFDMVSEVRLTLVILGEFVLTTTHKDLAAEKPAAETRDEPWRGRPRLKFVPELDAP
jgi:hypothetical protein